MFQSTYLMIQLSKKDLNVRVIKFEQELDLSRQPGHIK